MTADVKDAIADLKKAQELLQRVLERKCYTIAEMREVRTLLLQTVRNNIDSYALGHAREERRY